MRLLNSYNICFIGKTGYGKSSLINALFGTHFSTDPFHSCTKELYSVSILDRAPKGYDCVTVYDTPGIGDFPDNDVYQAYYDHAVSIADVIVLVVTFAKTDAPEQELLQDIKQHVSNDKKVKFIIALNHIDSTIVAMDPNYIPWDEDKNEPTLDCNAIINERKEIIHQKFDDIFMKSEVVPVCALREYGIEELRNQIITK